jgi:ribosomal protein S18 acetylase RimI-like enzyme
MSDTVFTIRKAVPAQSRVLAELMNTAGDGIPAYLWAGDAAPGEDAIDVGARRVARAEGNFSYANTHIVMATSQIAGMLLSYRLPDPCDPSPGDAPEVVRPLLELESLVPGSWYVNAVAISPGYRGQGVGSRLLGLAEALARAAGATTLSLVVAEANSGAKRLYERLDYACIARRPIVPFPGAPHEGDWLLMTKPVPAHSL